MKSVSILLIACFIMNAATALAAICSPDFKDPTKICLDKECAVIGETKLDSDQTNIIACLYKDSSMSGKVWKAMTTSISGTVECVDAYNASLGNPTIRLGNITNHTTYTATCPDSYYGTACDFVFMDNNGGAEYTGSGPAGWSTDRKTCSVYINDGGMYKGGLLATCCRAR